MVKDSNILKPGRRHNCSAFVFCALADACRKATGGHAGCQEVSMCSTTAGSQRMYITITSAKVNKAEPTLI